MQHIRMIRRGNLWKVEERGCRDCMASCQSACKTSCTVGHQVCRQETMQR
ncbi:MAG: six-cysteine peptide SCIFF [Firmicutes bacterium]|nr:six-cysteine peptide SCIFF [Bacillota bacterium]